MGCDAIDAKSAGIAVVGAVGVDVTLDVVAVAPGATPVYISTVCIYVETQNSKKKKKNVYWCGNHFT